MFLRLSLVILALLLLQPVTANAGYHNQQGPQGEQGIQGDQGHQGETGAQGEVGQNGSDASVPHLDYGPLGQVVLYETPNTEWGAQGSYDIRSSNTRVYAYGKVYLNRMFWQKKEIGRLQ